LLTELSLEFGSQAVVLAIDAKRKAPASAMTARKRASDEDRSLTFAAPIRAPNVREGLCEGTQPPGHSTSWTVYTRGGRDDEGLDAVEWAARGEALGAGEILLTSMDTDGVQGGFDCELTRAVSRATHIPVIASGGAGGPEDFLRVLTEGEADAALAASIFHYGTYTVDDLKEFLGSRGIPVRRA
jgi:imidazoleglycerol phosphate synthase cyclase subunit